MAALLRSLVILIDGELDACAKRRVGAWRLLKINGGIKCLRFNATVEVGSGEWS